MHWYSRGALIPPPRPNKAKMANYFESFTQGGLGSAQDLNLGPSGCEVTVRAEMTILLIKHPFICPWIWKFVQSCQQTNKPMHSDQYSDRWAWTSCRVWNFCHQIRSHFLPTRLIMGWLMRRVNSVTWCRESKRRRRRRRWTIGRNNRYGNKYKMLKTFIQNNERFNGRDITESKNYCLNTTSCLNNAHWGH